MSYGINHISSLSLSLYPQIFSVAILLYTPLICHQPIAVPILAAYGGVLTRCTISLIGFYYLVFPKLGKATVVSVLYKYVECGRSWWLWVVVAQWLEHSPVLFHIPLFSLCYSINILLNM